MSENKNNKNNKTNYVNKRRCKKLYVEYYIVGKV